MNKPATMRSFSILWAGQFISMIGSGMTQFALAIWIWQRTNQVTPVTLTSVFFFAPLLIVGPFAGALVDRLDRKRLMLLCDTVAGAATLILFALFLSGKLEVWQLYLSAFVSGSFQALQVPALMASVSTMVPEQDYSRAAGLLGLADTVVQVLAPVAAGLLYALISVQGILLIDLATFIFAVSMTLRVQIPQPTSSTTGQEGKGSLLHESLSGFRFILKRRNLVFLLIFMLGVNVVVEPWSSLLSPMILARTGSNTAVLGLVQAAGFIGAFLSGLILARLRSPKNFMSPLLICLAIAGLITLPIAFESALILWLFANFAFFFLHSFIGAYHQSIWQAKVPPDLQGRVFAARRLILGTSGIMTPILIGQLADRVFEPAIAAPTQLNAVFGGLVGTHAGDGMAALFVVFNLILLALAVGAFLIPALRNLEIGLPTPQPATQPA